MDRDALRRGLVLRALPVGRPPSTSELIRAEIMAHATLERLTRRSPEPPPGPARPLSREEAIRELLAQGIRPGKTMPWGRYIERVASLCGVPPETKGYSEVTLRRMIKPIIG